MDNRDASIQAQVSFKAAIDVAVADQLDFGSDEGRAKFENTLGYLHDSLTSHISGAQNVVAPSVEQAADKVKQSFPGTTEVAEASPGLVVKNEQQGPLPDWLIEKAGKAKVTSVYDNRAEASGTKKPQFKAADGTMDKSGKWPMGFWPD